jgi:hypothetical protein
MTTTDTPSTLLAEAFEEAVRGNPEAILEEFGVNTDCIGFEAGVDRYRNVWAVHVDRTGGIAGEYDLAPFEYGYVWEGYLR